MPDRDVQLLEMNPKGTNAILHLWDLDLYTQIARLHVLNRSEAELARAIQRMIEPSTTGEER